MADESVPARRERLRSVPLFAELADDALDRILDCATSFEAPVGHVLAEAKLPGSGLFVIEEGTVTIEVPGHPRDIGPGDFFGELALLTPDAVRSARVQAKTRVRCLALARHDFEAILASEPKMALALLRAVANKLVDSTHH